MTQNDCRRLPQSREKPSFPPAEFRHLKNHHLRPAWKAGHADFGGAALWLDDSVDEKSRNGRRRQHGKKGQSQNQCQQFCVPPRWIPQFRKDVHASPKPLGARRLLFQNSLWTLLKHLSKAIVAHGLRRTLESRRPCVAFVSPTGQV